MNANSLLTAALSRLSNDDSLHGEISAWLSEPVHVGDTLTFKTDSVHGANIFNCWTYGTAKYEGTELPEVPEGIEGIERRILHQREDEIVESTYMEWRIPEVSGDRFFTSEQWAEGVVVSINDRNYRIGIVIEMDEYGEGTPQDAVVSFVRTDDAETVPMAWDAEATCQARLANLRRDLAHEMEDYDENTADDYHKRHVAGERLRLAQAELEHAQGIMRVAPREYRAKVFGQPDFIQNPAFIAHEGTLARHLATLEIGWGDSGNVNILFSCDENGVPCKVWFEASCA